MNRREFLKVASAGASGALVAGAEVVDALALGDAKLQGPRVSVLQHRFGVNYVPSRAWYFRYNEWDTDAVARDFDRIAEIGADHMRVMLIWPWFQPNPSYISTVHLDRFDQLMTIAVRRKLDVLATIYTGWLSGFHMNPPFLETEPFYTSPKWARVQALYLDEVSKRLVRHQNFLGFDVGNEINCNWSCSVPQGDAWMKRVMGRMRALCPTQVHVNGVDHQPWFKVETFSPEALTSEQPIVALHCWPFWTGAGNHGKPLDAPYVRLAAGMALLARSYARDSQKPIWIQEFGACSEEMPEADVPRWMEKSITSAVDEGVSWFTWWASHDVDRRFEFHPFEYNLGLMTADNRIKDQGRVFKQIADAYRGKAVNIRRTAPLPPPRERNEAATWDWLLDWMQRKKA